MGKHGTHCCTFGCNKRFKKRRADTDMIRSDSEGPSDKETIKERTFARTFHR